MLPIGQGQEVLPTAIAKRHLDIPVLLTLSPVYSCPSHSDNHVHPGSATVAVPGKTGDKAPAKSLRVLENPKYTMARRIFLVPQLNSFWELLRAKSKQMQKPPGRPKPQQTSPAERVLPAQPPSDSASRGAQRQGEPQKHRVLPKTKLSTAAFGRVGSRALSLSLRGG